MAGTLLLTDPLEGSATESLPQISPVTSLKALFLLLCTNELAYGLPDFLHASWVPWVHFIPTSLPEPRCQREEPLDGSQLCLRFFRLLWQDSPLICKHYDHNSVCVCVFYCTLECFFVPYGFVGCHFIAPAVELLQRVPNESCEHGWKFQSPIHILWCNPPAECRKQWFRSELLHQSPR